MQTMILLALFFFLCGSSYSREVDSYRKAFAPVRRLWGPMYASIASNWLTHTTIALSPGDGNVYKLSFSNGSYERLVETHHTATSIVTQRHRFGIVCERCLLWLYIEPIVSVKAALGPCDISLPNAQPLDASQKIDISHYFHGSQHLQDLYNKPHSTLFRSIETDFYSNNIYVIVTGSQEHLLVIYPDGTLSVKSLLADDSGLSAMIDRIIYAAGYLYYQIERNIVLRSRTNQFSDKSSQSIIYEKLTEKADSSDFANLNISILLEVERIKDNLLLFLYVNKLNCTQMVIYDTDSRQYDVIYLYEITLAKSLNDGHNCISKTELFPGSMACRKGEYNIQKQITLPPSCFMFVPGEGLKLFHLIEINHPGLIPQPEYISIVDNQICWKNEIEWNHLVWIKIQSSLFYVERILPRGTKCFYQRDLPRGVNMVATVVFDEMLYKKNLFEGKAGLRAYLEYVLPPRNIYYSDGRLIWEQPDEEVVERYQFRCSPACLHPLPPANIMRGSHIYSIPTNAFSLGAEYELFVTAFDSEGRASKESHPVYVFISPLPGPKELTIEQGQTLTWKFTPPREISHYILRISNSSFDRFYNLSIGRINSIQLTDLNLTKNRQYSATLRVDKLTQWSDPLTIKYGLLPHPSVITYDKLNYIVSWQFIEDAFWKMNEISHFVINAKFENYSLNQKLEARQSHHQRFHVVEELNLPVETEVSISVQAMTKDEELSPSSVTTTITIEQKVIVYNVSAVGINKRTILIQFRSATGRLYVNPSELQVTVVKMGLRKKFSLEHYDSPYRLTTQFDDVNGETPIDIELKFFDKKNIVVTAGHFHIEWTKLKSTTTAKARQTTQPPNEVSWVVIFGALTAIAVMIIIAFMVALYFKRSTPPKDKELTMEIAKRRISMIGPMASRVHSLAGVQSHMQSFHRPSFIPANAHNRVSRSHF